MAAAVRLPIWRWSAVTAGSPDAPKRTEPETSGMRWFTQEWDDAEWDDRQAVIDDYRRNHLPRLRSRMPQALRSLAFDYSLHDAQIESWSGHSESTTEVRLLVGDLQVGYTWLNLSYLRSEVAALGVDARRLDEWLPHSEVEVLHDELDWTGDKWVHRMALWPKGIVGIQFEGLRLSTAPAHPDDRR